MKYAIFGCGNKGKKILKELGKDKVVCFIDNDKKKQGDYYNEIPIINLESYIKLYKDNELIMPVSEFYYDIKKQLQNSGIDKWIIFKEKGNEGVEDTLIVNPYKNCNRISYEKNESKGNRVLINDYAKQLYKFPSLFEGIEIETYNRCNGNCSFCPVSVKNDTREFKKMSPELFKKIIDELGNINYMGKLSLFSNNEPFLDNRIIDFHRYAREKLPNAHLYLYTNGTLLTLDKFNQVIDYLDELIIDNYNQELNLIPNVKKIVDICNDNRELKKKVTVYLRKPYEILTSRGGDAPNKAYNLENYGMDSCVLPFKQMIVRPDGKVSLCCNDPLGRYSLGDLNVQTIEEIWYGEEYQNIRNKILKGRKNITKCGKCDVFLV